MDARIELRHLRYFLAVAEELHFGRAAHRLHIAQPALSQQIRQLEGLMHVPLFTRTSRAVALTEAGRSFRPRASELLARLSSDLDEAQRVARGESGRIDLAFISSASGMLSAMLRCFIAQRPGVQVQLHEGFTAEVMERLARGTADLGIVRDAEAREGIALTTLLEEPFMAVLSTDHPLAAAASVTAAELALSPLVLFPYAAGSLAHARNLQPFQEAGLEPEIRFRGSQWRTICQLVAQGLGVTVAPASAVEPLPAGARAIPLGATEARSAIQIAHRVDDDNGLVRAFKALATGTAGPVT